MDLVFGYRTLLVIVTQVFINNAVVVQEKTVTSCNSPCNRQQLSCPRGYRIALRDAMFSVHQRAIASPCSPTEKCGDQSVCCERAQASDCVFNYSPSHLEALHRNCSGSRECEVKTERTQEESIACPFLKPQDTVSHSILDYVCIDEKAMLDVCSPTETTVLGRTLFAMLDSGTWRSPLDGAVCRCTAESSRWPTTNTIAVFVVDVRLNMLRQSQCSKAEVVLRSASTTRHLDCETSKDPRLADPFLALLNHSNVATVELFLHSKLPEYIWIGFESNEAEDIRLTCGMQGYVPILPNDSKSSNGSAARLNEGIRHHAGLSGGAIAGILVGIILGVIAVVIFSVLFFKFKREKNLSRSEPYSEPLDTLDDVYYSMPDVTSTSLPQGQVQAQESNRSAAKNGKKKSKDDQSADGEDGEVYITAEQVRERKRKSEKKRVRIVSIPEIANDVEEDYDSPWDIQERRRRDENPSFSPALPPRVTSPGNQTLLQSPDSDGESYATLDRTLRRSAEPPKIPEEEEYDHLSIATRDKSVDGQGLDDRKVYSGVYGRPEPDGCNQNQGFSEDGVFE